MVRSIPLLALLALMAGCGTEPRPAPAVSTAPVDRDAGDATVHEPAPEPQPSLLLLTPEGLGPMRIGMSRAEAVAALGDDAQANAVGGPDPASCDEFRPRNAPEGVLVMIRNGVLERISVSRNAEISTAEGFRVGDSGTTVRDAYGTRAEVEPHKYVEPPARYITVWSRPGEGAERRGIRYEINADDKVAFLRGGGPGIELVEGCL